MTNSNVSCSLHYFGKRLIFRLEEIVEDKLGLSLIGDLFDSFFKLSYA